MNRRTGTLALLAALCVLAAAVEARSPTLRGDADADKYCAACVDGQEPQYRLARGEDEVKLCDDRYYCDCQAGTKERCAILHKFNPDRGECVLAAGPFGFSCQEWMDKNPTPAPAPATSPAPTSTSRPAPTPTAGSTTKGPAPGTSTIKPAPGTSTSKPAPGSSTSKPAPGSSTSKPAPGSSTSKPAPGSSTSKPAPGSSTSKPAPGSSTSKPAPAPGSSTIKPKPNDAPWGHRAGLGLLALGVAAALL